MRLRGDCDVRVDKAQESAELLAGAREQELPEARVDLYAALQKVAADALAHNIACVGRVKKKNAFLSQLCNLVNKAEIRLLQVINVLYIESLEDVSLLLVADNDRAFA